MQAVEGKGPPLISGEDVKVAELLIVDAMNVIGSRPDGWWKDRGGAMRAFALAVDEHARATGKKIVVVFDNDPGDLPTTSAIQIVIARGRGRNAADDEIARLVAEDSDPERLTIVTSDRELVEKVSAAGAQIESSGSFRRDLED